MLAPHVLERHVVQLADEQAGAGGQRLQPGMLDLVLAAHLLDQQLGVGADLHVAMAVIDRPLERGQQAVVFGDVVGGDAERAVQLFDQRAVGVSMRTP